MFLIYLIPIGLVVAAFVTWLALKQMEEHDLFFFPFVLGVIGTGVASVIYCIAAWDWAAAQYKASIINREYHTNYTQEEIFFASDVIETVRQLDRKRYEVNGNLLRPENKELQK